MKKQLMKLFPNLFKSDKALEFDGIEKNKNLNIVLVDPESNSINEALGISEEHSDKLIKIANTAYRGTDRFTDAIKIASENTNHVNELAYAVYILTRLKAQDDASRRHL